MAYQTGAATSQNDLLQQLVVWLQGQGWTLDDSQADGAGWRAHLHKDGWYLHLKTSTTGSPFGYNQNQCTIPTLCLYMSSAYAGIAQPWNASVTGAPVAGDAAACGGGIVVNTGANAVYHFFHDGSDHYTIVVERITGLCNVMGFGLAATKHGGDWVGGPYFHGQISTGNTGNYPLNDNSICPFSYGTNEYAGNNLNSAFVRADVDTFVDNWVCVGPKTVWREGWTGRRAYSSVKYAALPATIPHTDELVAYLVSSINSQAVLLPIRIFVETEGGGPCLLATIPAVFQCTAVGNGYLMGDEIELGADTYKIFPNFAVKKVA